MPGKIEKPARTKFWIARNADGSVLHYGQTEPDQVTESGQPEFAPYDDESDHLAGLSAFPGHFAEAPEKRSDLRAGDYWRIGDRVVRVKTDHNRSWDLPDEVPGKVVVPK